MNGWYDIDIIQTNGNIPYALNDIVGTIYCGESYMHNCDISKLEWTCQDPAHYCNNPNITDFNTILPLSTQSSSVHFPHTISHSFLTDLIKNKFLYTMTNRYSGSNYIHH